MTGSSPGVHVTPVVAPAHCEEVVAAAPVVGGRDVETGAGIPGTH